MTSHNSQASAPAQRPAAPRAAFRADLAGLRGVAVLLVAVYHVWIGRVSGGVDVFLLMSAFFLTASWTKAEEAGRPRGVLDSWLRRLRGLLPAAALVIVAVLCLVLPLLPATRWPELVSQAWSSLSYTQNLHLQQASVDYYNPDHSSSSPLQHFWSLSVQGQVFLLWPLLLAGAALAARWVSRRWPAWGFRRLALLLFGAVFVASLAYSISFTATDQGRAYFSTPARLWEFALGSLLALSIDRLPALPSWLARVLGWGGLLALLFCGVILQVQGQFPGYAALWPTLAAAAIIVAGNARAASRADVGWWLSRRPVTWLGSISYPLYLWHWPVLVLPLALWNQARPTFWQGAVMLAVAILLAWATHRWLERPLSAWARAPLGAGTGRFAGARRRVLTRARAGMAAFVAWFKGLRLVQPLRPLAPPASLRSRAREAASRGVRGAAKPLAVVVLCSLAVVPAAAWQRAIVSEERTASAQVPQDNPGAATLAPGYVDDADPAALTLPLAYEVKQDWAVVGRDCDPEWLPEGEGIGFCQEGGNRSSERTIVVVGDSHAQQWTPAVDVLAQQQGVRWVLVAMPGCRYGSTDSAAEREDCALFNEEGNDYVLDRADKIEAVITIATRTYDTPRGDAQTPGESETIVPGYRDAVSGWIDAGLPVIGLRDTPRFVADQADCVATLARSNDECGGTAQELLAAQDPLVELSSGAGKLDGFGGLDMSDVVCPDGQCTPVIGKVNVWMDNNHMTARFAQTAGEIFSERYTTALEGARAGLR